jgi:uncharacterized protein
MNRYYDLNSYFKSIFGERVHKIALDAGLSCPNRDGTISKGGCIYCNDRGSGTGANAKGLSITEQIMQNKKFIAKRFKVKKFMGYFQSYSNTYAPFEKLKQIYSEALSMEDIVGITIGTRPDCITEKTLFFLEEYAKEKLIWIEYGLQSAHDKTLKLINRGHDFDCFKKAVSMTKNIGIKICAHVILGLPEEKKEDMLKTAEKLAGLDIDGIKLHLLYVIKGTKLAKIYKKGEYKCLEQEEYIDILCDFLGILPKNIVIQRLTGDPHPHELVAPMWAMQKRETLNLIKKELEIKNIWQGKFSPKL